MREIEFRAWTGLRMIEWDEMQTLHMHTVFKMCSPELTIMQFTGLRDKNGVKIFEGDILDEDGSLFIVAWDDDWAKFKLQYTSSKSIQYPEWNRGKKMIIVGDIHQNPELLEK